MERLSLLNVLFSEVKEEFNQYGLLSSRTNSVLLRRKLLTLQKELMTVRKELIYRKKEAVLEVPEVKESPVETVNVPVVEVKASDPIVETPVVEVKDKKRKKKSKN